MRLTEIWRATVPGHTAHVMVADGASKSLFVGDGWGVPYRARRLHRFDPETGEQLAEVRSREQQVSALAVHDEHVFAATSSRLLKLRPSDLAVVGHWEKVLPSDSQQMLAFDRFVVAANWRKPAVGVFDLKSRSATRLAVGPQPLLAFHQGTVKVIEGFHGGLRALDPARGRLLGAEPTPAAAAVAAGADIWAVAADAAPETPTVWGKPGADRIIRLTGESWHASLPEPGHALVCDDRHGLLWCLTGPERATLVLVSQEDGRVTNLFLAGAGRAWAYLHPASGLAVASEAVPGTAGYRATPSLSTLIGHRLVV
ncbi:MAG: PQQ-binding-like beta-propeller repeat protein [Acidimicrobiales bacterium]|nr:PQQ-binding-like beta-propeller repeat protein [Acidimicrobiales bacterium]